MKRISLMLVIVSISHLLTGPIVAQNRSGTDNQSRPAIHREARRNVLVPPPPMTRIPNFTARTNSPISEARPDPAYVFKLNHGPQPSGGWGGPKCPTVSQLRSLVDDYLATPNPDFPGLGPTIVGTSVSWDSPNCGTFNYAAGLRNIETNKSMTPATLMGIASMTKPIIAAITLKLSEQGTFGKKGLDTPVSQLLSPTQITELTVGDPSQPRCPGFTYLLDRDTNDYIYEWTEFSCPDLSRVTLRHLLRGNDGMYDFLNEVILPDGNFQYDEAVLADLFRAAGIDPVPPANSTNGYDYLKSFGLKHNNNATIGGLHGRDFEISLGNTGFQLLGVILENRTAKSLDQLVREMIVEPLGLDPIEVNTDPNKRQNLVARGYEVLTGDPFFEQFRVYPEINFHGHLTFDTLSFGGGQPGNINLAGGAGSLIANPKSYRIFLNAYVNGGLLGPAAQKELDDSFVIIPEYGIPPQVIASNGYGVYKISFRGVPGIPDIDYVGHDGSLPGVLCRDGIVRPPDSRQVLATGVLCQNANGVVYPDQFNLFRNFVNVILNPPPAP